MSTFTAIKKKGDVVRNETLPFNPLQDGFEYTGACCCEVKFAKGNVRVEANVEHKVLRIYRQIGKKLKLENIFRLPSNQLEFSIKANGINYN